MKRDTKIAASVFSAIPVTILLATTAATWALAHGASPMLRLVFRLMCHGMPRRSLTLFDVPMPLCARCVGIYIGLLAGLIAFTIVPKVRERLMRGVAFAAVLPLAVDGLTQAVGLRESTNPLRLATGIVAAFAFGMWALCAVERTGDEDFTAP